MDDVRLRLRSDRSASLTSVPPRSRASPVLSLTPSLPSTVIFIPSPPCTPAHPHHYSRIPPPPSTNPSLCARARWTVYRSSLTSCVFCFLFFSRRHRRYRRRYFILPYYSPIQLGPPLLPSPPAHTRSDLAPVRVLAPVHALTATRTREGRAACGGDVCVRTGTLLQLRSAFGAQLL